MREAAPTPARLMRWRAIPAPVAGPIWVGLALASWLVAASIALDTLRTIFPLLSPLPWLDDWYTVGLLKSWLTGERSLLDVLTSWHNEHRLLVPRLVFFADDLFFDAQGKVTVAVTFVVQALHATLLIAVLRRARPRNPGAWAIAGVVVALMFTLRQAGNFISGFQLQFPLVFTAATAAFLAMSRAMERADAGRSAGWSLAGSGAAAFVATFSMANGLLSPIVITLMAITGRMRIGIVLGCAGFAAVLAALFLHGYAEAHQGSLGALRQPLAILSYVAAYLGGVATTFKPRIAVEWGTLGILLTMAGAVRVARQPKPCPQSLALVAILIFVGCSAAATSLGRLDPNLVQPLSTRYSTGSAAFWAAQLVYWWADPPTWSAKRDRDATIARLATAVVAGLLLNSLAREQNALKPSLYDQAFRENDAENLLLLGLKDPKVFGHVAWPWSDAPFDVFFLKQRRLSVFATPEAYAIGKPVSDAGRLSDAAGCEGRIVAAEADPSLGADGVRIAGQASADGRGIRRLLVADARGVVAGLASGGVPDAAAQDWRGYAVAPAGAELTAYALLDDGRLCRLGTATVPPPAGGGGR